MRKSGHMGGAITPGVLEGVSDLAVFGERQAFFGHRRSGDIAAEAFELVAFMSFRRDPGMQRESGDIARAGGERFIDGGRGVVRNRRKSGNCDH